MTDPTPNPPSRWGSALRTGLGLAVILAIAFGTHLLLGWVMDWTASMDARNALMMQTLVLGAVLVGYAVLIAIPFVPGIEIGISLVLMHGADVAVLVYLATVAGLALSFIVGSMVPLPWLHRLFLDLRLKRAAALMERIQPLSPDRRLALLRRALPGRLGNWAVDYRYLLLAGLINMPGSGLIGGGGGLCLLAGLTGLFHKRTTLLTIALAVLPFPLFVWFWGPGLLG